MTVKKPPFSAHLDVLELDRKRALDGSLPDGEHPHVQDYLNHFRDWNARKCEGSVLAGNAHPLLKLRALVFRGDHDEADTVIRELTGTQLDPRELGEALLQKARLASMKGQWSLCAELASAAAAVGTDSEATTTPLMRLTLLQVEALARYEMGEFSQAQSLLERAESLGTVFPNCTSATYSKILQIKISARRQGPAAAAEALKSLWRQLLANGALDLNLTQALLRTEIDLRRLAGLPHFRYALASLWIAEKMGEKLYAALGVFDCFHSAQPGSAAYQSFEARLIEEAARFERVGALVAELDGRSSTVSTTAEAIQRYQAASSQGESVLPSEMAPKQFFISELEILVDLEAATCVDLGPYPQLSVAMGAFHPESELSKPDFFKRVWGNQKYAPHLHDQLIFGVQQRLKKKTGVRLISRENQLSLPELYIVK